MFDGYKLLLSGSFWETREKDHCVGKSHWLCFSSIFPFWLWLILGDAKEVKQKESQRCLRPGKVFWNWEGNKMVHSQFNWKLQSNILPPEESHEKDNEGKEDKWIKWAVCKGNTAQKETMLLQFLLLVHKVLNLLYICGNVDIHYTCICMYCADVFVFEYVHVFKWINMCVWICAWLLWQPVLQMRRVVIV